ncbi:hypothetical protein [Ralstonia sp. 24A2]|uniref:hypothetical protein n=1 Tax=Ralstonia sp. 24A2 TaxID=3447364 RepID=UPI003F6A3D62
MMNRIKLTLAALALGAAAMHPACAQAADSLVPPADRRSAEQTLLTYPEWFLVHSPAEYARTVQTGAPQDFPFIRHIGQLWSSYAAVSAEQVHGGYPANPGYHLMIGVLSVSTTVEYGLRSAYENTVGRLSWALSGSRPSAEDRYAATAAQDYVDFIRQEPWYRFDFAARLRHLWTDVPGTGANPLRKWERRYALTTEYILKALYGKLIAWATGEIYTPAQMTTDVVVDHIPPGWTPPARVSIVTRAADGCAVLSLPRYFDFRIAAAALAEDGIRIVDIAGNTSDVLITIWLPDGAPFDTTLGRVLFEQSLSVPAKQRRVGALILVGKLSDALLAARQRGWQVEHVYDY